MKNKFLFMLLMLFMCVMQVKAYDCYYENYANVSETKKTVVGYNIGGSLTIEIFKGKSVNLTADSSSNKSSYSLDKCYDYVGVAVKELPQHSGYQISYKLGTSSDEVSFASNNDYAIMKKAAEPTENTSTNTGTKQEDKEEDLEIVDVDICSSDSNTLVVFRAIGYIIIFIKILVPVILIVLGSIEIGKAAIISDDTALNSAITNFAKKVLIGLIIFFIPTILDLLLGLVSGPSETAEKYETCTNCLLHPNQGSLCPIAETDGQGLGGSSGGGGAGRK